MIIKPPIGDFIKKEHPLTKGLLASWLMNERQSTYLYDSSNHLQRGEPTATAVSVETEHGIGRDLNSAGNRVLVYNMDWSFGDGAIELSFVPFWSGYTSLWRFWWDTTSSSRFLLAHNTTGEIVLYTDSVLRGNFTYSFTDGMYYHMVYNYPENDLYINGEFVHSFTAGGIDSSILSPFKLGCNKSNADILHGTLLQTKIYGRNLSAQEVLQLYADPYIAYRFNDYGFLTSAAAPSARPLPARVLTGPFDGPLGGVI